MLKLHDSLAKDVRPFEPADGRTYRIYACGPTVYHYAHIGNLRTFLTVDLLRRYLEYRGGEVRLVMNVTDVGHMLEDADVGKDKMEVAARREGKTPEEIARFYEAAFFRDLEALRFKPAWKHPRATEHIPQMVEMVETLLNKGHAYVTEKGDVYFEVSSFPAYGRLSGNSVAELVAGARVEVKGDKRHPADFALWINNPKHVMQWTGPRGIRGYPGWHLECSAMARAYLGETIDLHAAGEDLKFPHHECEIAQSESASGKPFSMRWLHVSHLLVEGEKMSKSKGNFYTLSDLVTKGYSPLAVRFLLLSAHYRTQLNFTLDGLAAAEKTLRQFREAYRALSAAAGGSSSSSAGKASSSSPVERYRKAFEAAMDDDLNVSVALAEIHGLIRHLGKALAEGKLDPAEAKEALTFLDAADAVFVFGFDVEEAEEKPPAEVARLLDSREKARQAKDWKESDRLREKLAELGWSVEDTPEGQKTRKA